MQTTLAFLGYVVLLTLIFWNYMQGKRIDALQQRVQELERK